MKAPLVEFAGQNVPPLLKNVHVVGVHVKGFVSALELQSIGLPRPFFDFLVVGSPQQLKNEIKIKFYPL